MCVDSIYNALSPFNLYCLPVELKIPVVIFPVVVISVLPEFVILPLVLADQYDVKPEKPLTGNVPPLVLIKVTTPVTGFNVPPDT